MNDDHQDHHRGRRWRLRGGRRPPRVPLERLDDIEWTEPSSLEPAEDPDPAGADVVDGDSALVERLRSMDWPKPSEEVRERGLRQILARMEESGKADGAHARTSDRLPEDGSPERPAHGIEHRHSLTRRAAISHRPALTLPERPVRRASAL